MNVKEKIYSIIKNNLMAFSIFFGLLISLGLKLEFIKDTNYIGYEARQNDVIYMIFTILVMVLIYFVLRIKDKRLWITSTIVGIVFSICYYFGDLQNLYMYTFVPTSKSFMLYSIIKIITYGILFTSCIVILFYKLPMFAKRFNSQKEWKYFTYNKKSIVIIAIIFFISYVPFFLNYYPGNVNTDSIGSLFQVTGYSKYTNFQPLLYTLTLGGIWNLGKAIFGSSVAGIALYTVFQMICTSFVFSIVLYYMAKRKIDVKWRLITFLFFILNPLNGWFVVRCEKGILFHLSMILVILGIIDIVYEKEKFFEKKWKPIALAIITFIMIFIRNNGIYSIILMLPFLIILCKNIWKPCIKLFGGILVLTLIVQGPIFKIMGINYSSPGEILSIPMQQYARIAKYDSDRLDSNDKEIYNKYFKTDLIKIGDDYVPWKSDSTKANFNADEFTRDKYTFLMQYIKFAIRFPMQTISSIVFNTGNNYSPNFNVWGIIRIYGTETEDAYGTVSIGGSEKLGEFLKENKIEDKPIIKFKYLDYLNEELLKGRFPLINMFIENIGFQFWIFVLCFSYCIYLKRYSDIIMLLPILALFITDIAAPMVDLRYIYPLFYANPIFIGIIIRSGKQINSKL